MQPIPASVRRLWVAWDVRVLVLLSLTLQIILFIFGSRRKYTTSIWISIVVWIAYLSADWVATVALGKLSDAQLDSSNDELQGIWAPLLLLHLGGPDTITAYALEDNQLWLRHFLGLGVQVVVATYVLLLYWRSSWFSILTFPVFVAGIIKYGERTWVLWSASDELSKEIIPRKVIYSTFKMETKYHSSHPVVAQALEIIDKGHFLLRRNATLTEIDPYGPSASELWKSMEVEMGLMYDLLYTKARITYTKVGCILRAISFSCMVFVLVSFFLIFIFMEEKSRKHYSIVDIAITGVLLFGAFVLEIYAVLVVLFSDWTIVWLIQHGIVSQSMSPILLWLLSKLLHKKRRWSNSMGQFDLVNFCRECKWPRLSRILRYKYNHKTYMDDNASLYPHLKGKIADFVWNNEKLDQIRCREVLEDHFAGIHIVEKIIAWHIATWILDNPTASSSTTDNRLRKTSKLLSNYMIHILVMRSSMIQSTTSFSDIRQWVSEEVISHLEKEGNDGGLTRGDSKNTREIFVEWLQQAETGWGRIFSYSSEDEMTRTNVRIAFATFAIVSYFRETFGEDDTKWEVLTDVWVQILCYVAKECQPNNHFQMLRRGGELLTLVWFFIQIKEKKETMSRPMLNLSCLDDETLNLILGDSAL